MAVQKPLKRTRSRSLSPGSLAKRCRQDVVVKKNVKFLILSDTHDAEISSFPSCDVLLHCGDLTEDGSPDSLRMALNNFTKAQSELKLFIAGNHEISLDKDYYLSEGGSLTNHEKSIQVVTDFEESNPGAHFLREGTHTFNLKSGATFTIYASPFTPQFGASAFQYKSGQDRFNPEEITPKWAKNVVTDQSRIPNGVDIIMTHGPPKYVLDKTRENGSAGCEHLRRAVARARPILHCFGHVHTGYGAQRIEFDDSASNLKEEEEEGSDCIMALSEEFIGKNGAKRKGYSSLSPGSMEKFLLKSRERKQTLMVNAAMENEEGKPANMPWLVELEL